MVFDPPGDSTIQHATKDVAVAREEDGGHNKKVQVWKLWFSQKMISRPIQEPDSLISFEAVKISSHTEIVGQPSPPPVLADVQDLIPTTNSATQTMGTTENASNDGVVCSEDPLELHIPTGLMNSFMKLAKSNTDKHLETCGVLAGSLKDRKFYVTALIIPKQESTSDS